MEFGPAGQAPARRQDGLGPECNAEGGLLFRMRTILGERSTLKKGQTPPSLPGAGQKYRSPTRIVSPGPTVVAAVRLTGISRVVPSRVT